jgi:hypothetical protein
MQIENWIYSTAEGRHKHGSYIASHDMFSHGPLASATVNIGFSPPSRKCMFARGETTCEESNIAESERQAKLMRDVMGSVK